MSKYVSPVKSTDLEHYLAVNQGMKESLRHVRNSRKLADSKQYLVVNQPIKDISPLSLMRNSSRKSTRKTPPNWSAENELRKNEWKDRHFDSFVAHVKDFVKYLKANHKQPSLSEYNNWLNYLKKNNYAYFDNIPAATGGNVYTFRERVDYAGKLYNSSLSRKRKRSP